MNDYTISYTNINNTIQQEKDSNGNTTYIMPNPNAVSIIFNDYNVATNQTINLNYFESVPSILYSDNSINTNNITITQTTLTLGSGSYNGLLTLKV